MNGIKYRSAEEMKDSGNKWIGYIPRDWKVKKIKHLASVNMGQSPDSNYVNQEGLGISFLQGKAEFGLRTPQAVNYCTKPTKIAQENSILFSVRAPVGDMNFADKEYCIGRGLASIIPSGNLMHLYYSLMDANEYVQSVSTGSTFDAISTKQLLEICIPNCSDAETYKIANFLDIKTAQFDSIIAKKEQLIAKLEEAKKSLISEVVTGKVKIIDGKLVPRQPDEMKDSGVEWLGMIPIGWDVKRIKYLFSLRDERNYKDMDNVQILSLYTSLGVKRQEEIEEKTGNVVRTVYEYKKVYPNDIVVNIILAWMGAIGMSSDYGVISPAYDIYKPNRSTHSKYYNYFFRTSKFAGECYKYGRGIMLMRWRTYSDEFLSFKVCIPPESVQTELSKLLDIKINAIDSVILLYKAQIEKIRSAKQSLISEAVTGKIDLRDWEIIDQGGAS